MDSILLTERVNHQTKERMRVMGVLKSWTRTSSPLQTMICLIPDGATAGLTSGPDMSTPSEAAPSGVGLRKVSLEGLLLAPLPAPYLVTTNEFSSPNLRGSSCSFNFCSLQIKCHWSLGAQGASGLLVQSDFLQYLHTRSQPVLPRVHRLPSWGC